MVKLFRIIFVTFFALCCCDSTQQSSSPDSATESSPSSTNSVPSTSRVYFHQAFSQTTSGIDEQPTGNNDEKKAYPSSIQAVNRSLEDATLKTSETRHLLGYEPETWNNRYTPPIPLDVLASETDEDEHDNDERADDDEGDNDGEESSDDGQTHDHHHHSDNDRDDDDVPENDGEVTEEYNDENAQKVIDEIDGDIHGQEGNNGQNDDFQFAATVQRPTIVKPEQDLEKQKRCKTIYREVNGFTPHSKLLSDDEDFDFQWRRKRSLDPPTEPKSHGPIGQAQSSSYMITRECTFDDEEDESGDDSAENADLKHNNNHAQKYNKIHGQSLPNGDVEKPGIASSSSWSVRSPQMLSSNPSSPPSLSSSPSSSSSSLPSPHTTGSRSESRFIPIFGWKKQEFITEDEPATYSDSMSNDFQPESNTFQPMNNDFGSHEQNDIWLQPNAQPWNEWNHFSGPNSGYTNTAGGESEQGHTENAVDEDDGPIWSGDPNGSEQVQNQNTESLPFESYFEWTPPSKAATKSRPHSDDGDDDGENQQEDEHVDDSGDDDGVNSEEDDPSRMDHSPAEHGAGNVRRMFTQHIRQRRSVQSYSGTLNNANFAWTQPAKNARDQLQHDTPYTWNYFQQEHPHKNDGESEESDVEQPNAEQFQRKPVHEEGGDAGEDDEGLSGENQENDDESATHHGTNDPDNYSNSYNGGNHEEYNIDYDSDRLADNGAGYKGGKQQDENAMDDDDEFEKF